MHNEIKRLKWREGVVWCRDEGIGLESELGLSKNAGSKKMSYGYLVSCNSN